MKKSKKYTFILIVLCIAGALTISVAATQISLDSPATLPSDI